MPLLRERLPPIRKRSPRVGPDGDDEASFVLEDAPEEDRSTRARYSCVRVHREALCAANPGTTPEEVAALFP